MRERILEELDGVESAEGVKVLYACESGSRAWGFPSTDSDWDVRFLYLRPREWYLRVDTCRRRDVIERPVDEGLDLSGWDLRKALNLFRRCNPPLLEWLESPIVYGESSSAAGAMRRLAADYYSSKACTYHYLHMARKNHREFLTGESVWIKKYFYVLRPILAVRWIERGLGVVPMEFAALVERIVDSEEVRASIVDLLAAKSAGEELDRGPRIPILSDYIEGELTRHEGIFLEEKGPPPPLGPLNELFLAALDEVWGESVS